MVASSLGCVNLFHSTDFGGACPEDAAGCREAAPVDATKARDVREDHATRKPQDATIDHDGGATKDAARDAGAPPDAGHDAQPASDARPATDAPTPADSGTNFCAWDSAMAQASAQHACLWLGACAGNAGLNAYGTCYPNALLAYDCELNPNQQVRGALHAFWDALWHATSCKEVLRAVFPAGVPKCVSGSNICGNDLPDADVYRNVAVACAAGAFASAVNCQMAGYTCSSGVCTNGGAACKGSATAGSCAGSVFHSCQFIENNPEAGTRYAVVDVGKDCTDFGAGSCVVDSDSGIGGCQPNDASTPCTPSSHAACATGDPTSVTGCATGHLETLHCPEFGPGAACSVIDGGWFASGDDLTQGCYNPAHNGYGKPSACGPGIVETYAGPAGYVLADCLDAGLDGGCVVTSSGPRCRP